jgi:hypothetical protein
LGPEPNITTKRCASFAYASPITCHQSPAISNNLFVIANGNVGDGFRNFYSCTLLDILMMPDLHQHSVCKPAFPVNIQFSCLLTIMVYQ